MRASRGWFVSKTEAWLLTLLGALAVAVTFKPPIPQAFGSAQPMRSLERLREPFRTRARAMLARLDAQGVPYFVHETDRNEARARMLTMRGTGIVKSQHRLGLAMDVLPARGSWPNASDPFWGALAEAALAEGLQHGVRHRGTVDLPHVQLLEPSRDGEVWAAYESGRLDALLATV